MPKKKRSPYRPKPLVFYCPECPCREGYVDWKWSRPYPKCPEHDVDMVEVRGVGDDTTARDKGM